MRLAERREGRSRHWWQTLPVGYRLLLPVLVLAGFLRTQHLSSIGLQCDESFIQKMVEFPWVEMFDRISLDTHPPLFHIVFKVWSSFFGESVAAGRSLTAFWGVAAVAGMYAFIRRAYRREDCSPRENFFEAELPALLAALLLALAPLQVFWSMQIRMYSMAVALTAWSSFFLVRALLTDPTPNWGWTAYTLVAILLAYSHHFGLFVVAAQYTYALAYRWFFTDGPRFDRLAPALASAGCLFLAWQPGLLAFLQQHDQVARDFYLPKPSWSVLGDLTHELWTGFGVATSRTTGLIIAQASFLVLLVVALGRQPADYLIALSAGLPVAVALIISWVSQSILNARYFLMTQVFFIAAAAVVACRLPRFTRYVAIGLLVWSLSSLCHAHHTWRENAAKLPGLQAAVARIDAARGNEPLIVCNPMLYTSVLMYTRDRSQVYLFQPLGGFPFFQGTAAIRDDEYVDSDWLERTPAQSIWTLDADDDSMGSVEVPRGWKLATEQHFQEWYVRLIVRLYSRDRL